MNATRYIHRMHLRIRTLTALGILATALLAGLATTLPFYQASRSATEAITRLSVEAQADAVHHQLGRFQDIANQLTGRTEIRRRLADYARGELSREAATAYITPRLEDAMAQAPDVVGLVRLGPDGEEISRIGRTPANVQRSSVQREGYPCSFHLMEDDELLLQACAPIHSNEGEKIGRDMVYFNAKVLQSLLDRNERLGSQALIRLRASSGAHDLTLDATGFSLMPAGAHSHRASAERDIAFNVPIGDQGWQLLAEVPTQRFHQAAMQLLLWPALIILILAGAGTLVVSRALHPLLARVASQAQRLESSEQELRLAASVFRNAQEAIAITTPDHRVIDANPAFAAHLGCSRQALEDSPLTRLLAWHPDSQERLRRGQQQLEQEDTWQGEVRYRRANGDTLVALQTISAVRSDSGDLLRYIHIFNDIARLGGDEFVIVLHTIHADDDAARVASKVVDALTAPFTVDDTPVTIGVSVGVALYPGTGQDAESLIQAADAAMYRAKAAGRNTWRFHATTPGPETT